MKHAALHAGIKILVDPWLVDELVFFNQTWLYRGKKGALPPVDVAQIGEDTDVIIISQVSLPGESF